jgi:5-methylcytosine-specific restriction enzyme subunit McrC
MSKKNIIQVFEHESLTINDGRGMTLKHLDALVLYNDRYDNKYFTRIRDGIKFSQYVGVIQAGNLTIEILPKADKKVQIEYRTKQIWRDVLLDMLKECHLLRVDHVEKAQLNLRSNSLLDIYLELFLQETEQLIHEGLVKKYKKKEGNKLALKGQLQFSKNITYNLIHQERFYVRYTEFDRNNIFNQLLFKTLCLIPRISSNLWSADKVNRLLMDFPGLPDCHVSQSTFRKLVYDRKTDRYKDALLISKMILLNFRPDITGGSENVIAILFDMNELWEEFVFRRLAKSATKNTKIARQQKKDFWWNVTQKYYKQVKPDIVITKDLRTIIVDTKWKIVNDNSPADDDLKQMFVYNLLWNADKSVLLYPGTFDDCEGSYVHFHLSSLRKKADTEIFYNHCSLEFLNVLDKNGKLVTNEPFVNFLDSL